MNRYLEKQFVEHIIYQEEDNPLFLAEIIGAGQLSPKAALDIYRGDYNARLEEALQNKFEGVYLIAGPELFSDLAQLFLTIKKSTDPDLQKFGEEFPLWLKNSAPLNEGMSFLSEVAKVDLAFHHLFHLNPLTYKEDYSLTLDPAMITLNSQAPLLLIQTEDSGHSAWSYRDEDELPADFKWGEEEFLMIFKDHQRKMMSLKLTYPFYLFVAELKNGSTLDQAFLKLAQTANLENESPDFITYQTIMKLFQEVQFLQNKESPN